MINYVDADLIIEINNLESGQGILDRNGIEAAAERPWSTFLGMEFYPSPARKAGALFHALASTQYFVDGNKRTAWIAASFLFQALGEDLRELPVVDQETFALVVATLSEWDAERAGEWYRDHRLMMADRLDFAFVANKVTMDAHDPTASSIEGIDVGGLSSREFPVTAEVTVLFRVTWLGSDVGRKPKFTFSTRPFGPLSKFNVKGAVTVRDKLEDKRYSVPIMPGFDVHHLTHRMMPVVSAIPLEIYALGPGTVEIVAECEGEELFALPFSIDVPTDRSDFDVAY